MGVFDAIEDRFAALRDATVDAALRGPGRTSPALREALARGEAPDDLRAFADKIRRHAYRITDEEFAALRARYGEDELFEIVIATVLGAAGERLQAGLRALEEA